MDDGERREKGALKGLQRKWHFDWVLKNQWILTIVRLAGVLGCREENSKSKKLHEQVRSKVIWVE